jgi:hypothetical protein
MSVQHKFEIVCPNNHNQTVKFSQSQFNELLASGTLVFHCNTCESDWPPTREELVMFRKQFGKDEADS